MKTLKYLLITAVLSCSACSFPDLREAAMETNPATGKTPLQEIVSETPSLISNPLDIEAWGSLIQNIVILTAAGFGYKEWRKFRKRSNGS